MNRTSIINFYIRKYNFEKYLEIGVQYGDNIDNINAKHIDGVDPGSDQYNNRNLSDKVNYKMTSDEFFESIKDKNILYDFIFIDGLHEHPQVNKDINNSLNHLSPNGMIMLHDTLPSSFEAQEVPRKKKNWNGDVWKSVAELRCTRNDLQIATINTDEGCTLIKRGSQELYKEISLDKALTWEYFSGNKEKLMNIVTTNNLDEIL